MQMKPATSVTTATIIRARWNWNQSPSEKAGFIHMAKNIPVEANNNQAMDMSDPNNNDNYIKGCIVDGMRPICSDRELSSSSL